MSVSQCPVKNDSNPLNQAAGSASSVPCAASNTVWLTGGTAVLDEKGVILSANDTLAQWLGARPDELQGESFPALMGRRCPEWDGILLGSL